MDILVNNPGNVSLSGGVINETPGRLDCVVATQPVERPAAWMTNLTEFAARYTAAWCSQDAASVAGFFASDGSLTVNRGAPSAGRAAITAFAQSFMTAFPDLIVTMDNLTEAGPYVIYHWTLTGTNTGPGGSGKPVRISGYEEWLFAHDGLIAASHGYFDQAAYQKQL